MSGLSADEEAVAQCGRGALHKLSQLKDTCMSDIVLPNTPVTMPQQGDVGRPRFVISSEQLRYLVDNNFTVPQLLGGSRRSIERG